MAKETTNTDELDPGFEETTGDMFSTEALTDITAETKTPKSVDTTGVDKYISSLETPAGNDPLSKQAAYYRQKGEGDVLRMQKDIQSLFLPAVTMWQERTAAADDKYEQLKSQMKEFDDSIIFGEEGPNGIPMPIAEEVKNISTSMKTDLRLLSRLNINDERYDELLKKVNKDQAVVIKFDEINKKLIAIRNDIGVDDEGNQMKMNLDDHTNWSANMSESERRMWHDIYTGNGENIEIRDGKVVWIDKGEVSYDISGDIKQDLLKNKDGSDSSLSTMHEIRNKYDYKGGMEDLKKNKDDVEKIQKALLEIMPEKNLGTTGDDGDGADGDWGDLTQAAYSKYFRDKDELEKDFYDKNLTSDEKIKYGITTGGGKVVDLDKITQPVEKDAIALQTLLGNRDVAIKARASGADENGDENARNLYNITIASIESSFDKLGTEGQGSLLWDGIESEDKKTIDALPVKELIRSIMEKNGLDYSDQSINKMIEDGMLKTYEDPKTGEDRRLKDIFKDFYMDNMKEFTSSYTPPVESDGKGSGKGTGKGSGKSVFNNESYYKDLDGNTMQGSALNPIIDALGSETGIDGWIRQEDGSFKKGNQTVSGRKLLESIGEDISMSLVTMDQFKDFNTTVGGVSKKEVATNALSRISKITKAKQRIGDRGYDKGTIFKYGGGHVIKNLNKEYGDLGFVFENTGVVQDVIEITYTSPGGIIEKYSDSGGADGFDNMTGGADNVTASAVEAWMKSMINNYSQY